MNENNAECIHAETFSVCSLDIYRTESKAERS